MGRPRKCWSLRVGGEGHVVVVQERRPGGLLQLRWWTPGKNGVVGRWHYRALKHADRAQAENTARDIAAQLLASTKAAEAGKATLTEVFAAYEHDKAKHTKGHGPKEAKRRMAIWTTFFGANLDANTIDKAALERFARERRAGTIQPKGHELPKDVGNRAIAADIEFLRAALNHACDVKRSDASALLGTSPIAKYHLPQVKQPRRPIVTYDRYLKVLEHADAIDPQQLFGGFMTLVEGLGWRVSAICALRARDVDLTETPTTPHGRIYKNPANDKEGAGGWIPMSESVRAGVDRIRAANPSLGDWPLFPAPRARVAKKRREQPQSVPASSDVLALPTIGAALRPKAVTEIPKAWTRHHARQLLERAEKKAKLSAVEGSDFHCYRRKWATERKHLPDVDVARAGGWSEKDPRALKQSYQQADERTVLAVVSEPTKLRDVKVETKTNTA